MALLQGDLRIGTARPRNIKFGSEQVSKVMCGQYQVWPSVKTHYITLSIGSKDTGEVTTKRISFTGKELQDRIDESYIPIIHQIDLGEDCKATLDMGVNYQYGTYGPPVSVWISVFVLEYKEGGNFADDTTYRVTESDYYTPTWRYEKIYVFPVEDIYPEDKLPTYIPETTYIGKDYLYNTWHLDVQLLSTHIGDIEISRRTLNYNGYGVYNFPISIAEGIWADVLTDNAPGGQSLVVYTPPTHPIGIFPDQPYYSATGGLLDSPCLKIPISVFKDKEFEELTIPVHLWTKPTGDSILRFRLSDRSSGGTMQNIQQLNITNEWFNDPDDGSVKHYIPFSATGYTDFGSTYFALIGRSATASGGTKYTIGIRFGRRTGYYGLMPDADNYAPGWTALSSHTGWEVIYSIVAPDPMKAPTRPEAVMDLVWSSRVL